MYIPVEEIRKEIPPENYGLKEWLQGNLYKTYQVTPHRGRQIIVERISIIKPRESFEKGYDCFDAAKKTSKILSEHNIRNDVYKGPDELGIWDDHYFVKTIYEIVDPIDLYPVLGAKHFPLKKIHRNKMFEPKYTVVDIEGQGPLCYFKPSKNTKLLCRIGISRVSALDRMYRKHIDSTAVTLDGFLLEHDKPIQKYEVETVFDEASLGNELDASVIIPNVMSKKETMKAFNEMLAKNVVKLRKATYSLNLVQRGVLNKKKIKNKEVNTMLKEKIGQNLDILASLTIKIPNAEDTLAKFYTSK